MSYQEEKKFTELLRVSGKKGDKLYCNLRLLIELLN